MDSISETNLEFSDAAPSIETIRIALKGRRITTEATLKADQPKVKLSAEGRPILIRSHSNYKWGNTDLRRAYAAYSRRLMALELEVYRGPQQYQSGDLLLFSHSAAIPKERGEYVFIYHHELWVSPIYPQDFCLVIFNEDQRPLALPYPDCSEPYLKATKSYDPQLQIIGRVLERKLKLPRQAGHP
ncbi:hypothetical protein HCH52_03780 [Oscillospiraceae bacterium HV4-5-C5C]|nr:hypothetical protein [Oscillospiraceae bacterium HV4-5-C5C]